MQRFRSVVVITFASHAKGPQFETGRKHAVGTDSLPLVGPVARISDVSTAVGFCEGQSLTHVRPSEDRLRALVSSL